MAWLVPLTSLAEKRKGEDTRAFGGKAARLVWLVRHDFAVPEAWVLPQKAFAEALRKLPAAVDPKGLLRSASSKSFPLRVAEARQALLAAPLPEGLEAELEALWNDVRARAPWGLAVRSSATCEDGAVASMAGLAESKLAVFGRSGLAQAIREVWASIASDRALTYLAQHGVRDVGMAVVLQAMVKAEAAGVMFTREPSKRGGRVVNVTFGLGSPVVGGVRTPDMLRLDARGGVAEAVVVHKPVALVVEGGELVEHAVAAPDAAALGPRETGWLADLAVRLEALENVPWDVEFAVAGDRLWVVQARPVTGQGFPAGGDALTVWSHANVGEALPGVATPLTWSVAGAFSDAGFRRAFAALGCSVPKNAVLVGDVYGRFYLNLSQFMRIAAQVPWLEPKTLVELGGGAGGEELARDVADVSHAGFYARLPLTVARLASEQLRLDAEVARFERHAEAARKTYGALDLAILPDEGLAHTIRDLQALLEQTGQTMLTCASSALGSHLVLKTLLGRVAPGQGEVLAQALTAGLRDVESARPAIGMLHVAEIARREPAAMEAIARGGGLDQLPEGPTRRALMNFLELYGDRAVREAELSTPRWREDPTAVLTMLRVSLRRDVHDIEAQLARARGSAYVEANRLMERLGVVQQTALRHLVARAQKAVRLRERMRAWVTRVLGMLRTAFLDAERRLVRLVPELSDASGGADARHLPNVFFLTVDEVVTVLQTARVDVAPLVRLRRAELARNVARPDPPATFIGAPPTFVSVPSGGDVLSGATGCAGVVEGPARVIREADRMGDLQPGEILVVRATDVGWTPLFPMAAGIVTELGGPLSHAAIVARELGVPTVVNVVGATRLLRSGDQLRLDGERGTVERLRPRS